MMHQLLAPCRVDGHQNRSHAILRPSSPGNERYVWFTHTRLRL